jgi:hypothetical protein
MTSTLNKIHRTFLFPPLAVLGERKLLARAQTQKQIQCGGGETTHKAPRVFSPPPHPLHSFPSLNRPSPKDKESIAPPLAWARTSSHFLRGTVEGKKKGDGWVREGIPAVSAGRPLYGFPLPSRIAFVFASQPAPQSLRGKKPSVRQASFTIRSLCSCTP